jgi:hypothetical protein
MELMGPKIVAHRGIGQGCQIFLGATYQMAMNIPNDSKIFRMATKYNNIV